MADNCCNIPLSVEQTRNVRLEVSGDGFGTPYELPTMSSDIKGGAKLGDGLAVDENERLGIEDGGVSEAKLGDGAVTSSKLADGAVTTDKLDAQAVGETKLADSAVTSSKIADNAVTSSKIADGAVTLAKINSSISYLIQEYPIVETQADKTETTTDKLMVVSDTNHYQTNKPTSYIKTSGTNTFFDETRTDGTKITIPRLQDTVVASNYDYSPFITAMSWINKGVIYGNNGTIWMNPVNTETPQLVCSDYICALLRGVTYESSAIVKGSGNNGYSIRHCSWPNNLASVTESLNRNSYVSYELAYWLAVNGRLFYKSSNYLNIMPGDILFTGTESANPDTWLNIGHCQLVLGVYPDAGYAIVTECGVTDVNFYYGFYPGTTTQSSCNCPTITMVSLNSANIKAVGRPNYPGIQPLMNLLARATSSDNLTGTIASGGSSAQSVAFSSSGTYKQGTPMLCRIKGHIVNNIANSTDKAIDLRVQAKDGSANWYEVSRIRWARSLNDQLTTAGFWELPCCIWKDSTQLRLRIQYSGTGSTYDFSYDFSDVQFIELQ